MSGDEIDMKEWGAVTQMVSALMAGFGELRAEFKELRQSVGTRCTDCGPGEKTKDLYNRIGKIDDRLRFLEIKVAGIAVISGIASAVVVHVLTKALG